MTVIDLLRHGDTGKSGFRGRLDDALTATGWAQMRASAAKGGPWEAIVSSPLQRCAAFARHLAGALEPRYQTDSRLQELDFGRWEGMNSEVLMRTHASQLTQFWEDPRRHPPPEGECLSRFEARVLEALDSLVDRYRGRRILVITHAGVIRVLLCRARRQTADQLLQHDVPHAFLQRLFGWRDAEGRTIIQEARPKWYR